MLPVSDTQRTPLGPKPSEKGTKRPFWLVAGFPVARFGWPITMLILSAVVNGGKKATILLLKVSATQRSPEGSNARPVGPANWLELVPAEEAVNEIWPRTTYAAIPLERGALYSRTLLLSESETQRFPAESKAIPVGPRKPVWVAANTDVEKDD